MLNHPIIKCDVLSRIHLLIIFINDLTPQPTEQFVFTVPILLEGTVYIHTHTHTHTESGSELLLPLVNMIKEGCEN